jgi:hypothetical protein
VTPRGSNGSRDPGGASHRQGERGGGASGAVLIGGLGRSGGSKGPPGPAGAREERARDARRRRGQAAQRVVVNAGDAGEEESVGAHLGA